MSGDCSNQQFSKPNHSLPHPRLCQLSFSLPLLCYCMHFLLSKTTSLILHDMKVFVRGFDSTVSWFLERIELLNKLNPERRPINWSILSTRNTIWGTVMPVKNSILVRLTNKPVSMNIRNSIFTRSSLYMKTKTCMISKENVFSFNSKLITTLRAAEVS